MIWEIIKAILTLQILAAVFIVIRAQVNWDGKLPEDGDDEDEDEDDDPTKWL